MKKGDIVVCINAVPNAAWEMDEYSFPDGYPKKDQEYEVIDTYHVFHECVVLKGLRVKCKRDPIRKGWLANRFKVVMKESYDERTSSLDRINSKIGYVEGNVQWVDKDINKMKLQHSMDFFINMCKDVAIYHANRT